MSSPPDSVIIKSPERRHVLTKDNSTISRALNFNKRTFPKYRCFGTREFLRAEDGKNVRGLYEWYTYEQVYDMTAIFARGLMELGFKKGDKLLLMSANRTEWQIIDMAANSIGVIIVPIYDSQGNEEIIHVGNHSDAIGIALSLDKLSVFVPLLPEIRGIKHVIGLDDRLDDRKVLLDLTDALKFPPPLYTFCDAYTEAQMDEMDVKSGIADPCPPRMQTIFENAPRARRVGKNKYSYLPPEYVVPSCTVDPGHASCLSATFHTICAVGAAAFGDRKPRLRLDLSTPEDVWLIQYTSGTTSLPKGAVLTNSAIIVGGLGYTNRPPPWSRNMREKQLYMISYLPNAHIFQHVVSETIFLLAGATGFFQGSIACLMDDVQKLRPVIFLAVPRVLQRVVDQTMKKLEDLSPFKRFAFFNVYDSVRRSTYKDAKTGPLVKRLANVFFKDIKKLLGDRCTFIATGSAPLAPKTAEFFVVTMGKYLVEGYGLSETSAIGACQSWDDLTAGNVGYPMPNMEMKIVSVPELDYTVADKPNPRGEICFRGDGVFQHYYKDESKTHESLTEDGWYRTGDVGEILPDGKLKIIDRVRNIFKLAQGEFISAAKIEHAINQSPYVAQSSLFGSRFESYTLCAVNIDEAAVAAALSVSGAAASAEALSTSATAIELVHRDVVERCREMRLVGYEIPKALLIDPEVWSVENGLATPSMKLKTARINERHKPVFMEMYARIGQKGLRSVTPDVAAAIVLAAGAEPLTSLSTTTRFSRLTVFK
eukprot:gnl/Chilomastix_cuspidata/743.p1 GENE.gnl/Chilomastix_cuspidata/743~~gnl/Chilomastix_cuspidata/743.p1  ORF type:complete len:766 (-),score=272.99 gnl/Chilomastix_cuspidata/743:1241-3538(-)